MAYEVTATRRRPQQFEDLAGQEFVAETLKNSIKTKQFAHAYLFAGPRGCGKTSTARILAKALNCQAGSEPTCTPCGQCESCRAITNSSSMDVIEIDGASNTSVNDVRQIKDEVMFPPTSCRYKIYIIDEVHMLSTSAFNALLKTIEEPPAHVIFIFATTELQKVPATIKSRCQQYNFRLVSSDRLKELLSDACREMNIQADDEALYWIAKESGGSVRDCYTLFDQVAAFSDGHITYEKIRDKLGLLGIERLNTIFEFCAAGDSENVMNQLDSFLQSGISIEQLISNSSEYLRSLLLIKNGITKESLLGQSAERYSKKVLDSWSSIQTERAISLFLNLYRDIRYSLSPRYELELAFSRLCWLSQYVSPSEVKAAIDKAQSLLSQAGAAPAQTAAPQPIQPAQQSQPIQHIQQETHQEVPSQNYGSFSNAAAPKPAEPQLNANTIQNNGMPAGMHTFSALSASSPADSSSGGFSAEPNAVQENPNPFYNGGAVPPLQTAADDTSYDDLGNPEGNSYAPAEDDWQTFQTPETDEKLAESYENEFAEIQPQEEQNDPVADSAEAFVRPDGSKISLKEAFDNLVTKLSAQNPMASSALLQTSNWKIQGKTITAEIESDFQANSIKNAQMHINEILSQILGDTVQFELTKKDIQVQESHVEVPEQVKLLCNIFKGTIVGGKQ